MFGKEKDAVRVTLRQLSDAADPLTRTFEARYPLTGALADAPLGSTVTIDVSDDEHARPTGLRVPIAAVLDTGRGPGVWLISGTPTKVSWRPVAVQRVDDESMYVSGEIEQGDRVVALGAHLMRDGERVRIQGDAANRNDRP